MLAQQIRFLRLCAVVVGLVLLQGCECTSVDCGDGIVDEGETCDDGNGVNGDGCSAACQAEGPRCGDGIVDPGEECDDNNNTNGDGCSLTCQDEEEVPGVCGDGALDQGEECDDGNAVGGDGCSSTCMNEPPPSCGDGMVDPGEQCDDGNAVDGDGCESDCTHTPAVEIVCEELAPLPQGTCEVAPGDAAKLLVGTVLAPGVVYRGGRVAVDAQGLITCVGCDCDAPGATMIRCPTGVISPSLINPHDHITFTHNVPYTPTDERYEHRHDWRRGNDGHTEINSIGQASADQIRWGELRMLLGGATSINGSGSASGLLRNLDRAEQEGLGQPQVAFDTFPLGDSNGAELSMGCGYPAPISSSEIELYDSYCPHVAEGIEDSARNEFICLHTEPNDLVKPQSAFIHGVGLIAPDYAAMAANGTALIWSPRSNITLYGDTAMVTTAARLGVQIALGTDWMPTGSMNLLRELRCADAWNRDYLGGFFTDEELWRMVTSNAAAVLAVDDVIGSLAAGKVADIAIFDGAVLDKHRAVVEAEPQAVVLVVRGGKVLYGDANVVSTVPDSGACDALDVCGIQKQVCLAGDIGKTLAQLQASAGALYPAFFCGTPQNEPLCVPSRTATAPVPASQDGSTVYTGQPAADDLDGDGITDAMDNCPSVFNPARPLDDGAQADSDADGDGDACDVCPIDPGTTMCSAPDPNDNDGDGVANDADNCPNDPNSDQADADMDGKGDACDACPDDANPGTAGCPTTIYDIKDGTIPEGTTVSLQNALVTGKHANGFFLQVKPGDIDYAGPDYSGIYVYNPGNTVVAGDRVSITSAVVANFFGQIQLGSATVVLESSLAEPPPAPTVVAPADVATGGALAASLEGVIVEVQAVDVIALDAMFNEFIVTGNLRVNDLLYLTTPFPVIGDAFAAVRGILEFRNNDSKVEPRSAADLVSGPPKLKTFAPALSFTYVGQTGAPTIPTPLTVELTSAPLIDTFVPITSADPASLAVVNGGVTVLAGTTTAPVLVDGLVMSPSVALTASLGGVTLMADVRVLDPAQVPALVSLDPPTDTVTPGGTATLTITLDIPAPPGGTVVTLSLTPPTAGTLPASVTVPAGQVSATFDYTDGGTDPTAMVTATLDTISLSSTINVVAIMGTLVINEVDYDQINTDAAEFIEIYNGTGGSVDLAGHSLILVNGNGSTVYLTVDLGPAGTLASGQYLVVGAMAVTVPAGALKIDFTGTQTDKVQNGAPDGIALVNTTTSTLIDALSYEGSMTMVTLPGLGVVSLVEGAPTTASDSNTVVGSVCRLPDGADTNNAATDWAFSATPTPGAPNVP